MTWKLRRLKRPKLWISRFATLGLLLLVSACSPQRACPACFKQPVSPPSQASLSDRERTNSEGECTKLVAPEQGPSTAIKEPESPAASSLDQDWGRLVSFDCSSSLEHKQGLSLRSWNDGGPAGAAWNWYGGDLLCSVSLLASCDAHVLARLRVGEHYRTSQVVLALTSETRYVHFIVPTAQWQHELESVGRPFELGLFVVEIQARCDPDVSFFLSDSFIGGFSGGE